MMAKYFNTVFLRPDLLENLTTLLTAAACNAIADNQTKTMFQDFLLQVVENRSIKEGVFDNYVYSPIRSFFSFGYQQAEEERLKQEHDRQRSYQQLVDNTNYDP